MKYEFSINGEIYAVDAQRRGDVLLVNVDGETIEMRLISAENNRLTLSQNGKIIHLAGTRNNLQRQIAVNGQTVRYGRHTPESTAAADQADSLSSSIPAVVSEILVAVGDSVSAGQKLILLESMKMIIPIQAHSDGTIKKINCAAGDSIQPNIPLIEIEHS